MSANALLMTFIGGVGAFAGPIVGAILIVLLQSWVSLLSNSWLVYVGVLFILMVTFAPGGIAGLVLMHQPIARSGRMGRLAAPYARMAVPGLCVAVGIRPADRAVLLPHHRRGSQGKTFMLGGATIDPKRHRRGRSARCCSAGAASGSGARGAACARRGTRSWRRSRRPRHGHERERDPAPRRPQALRPDPHHPRREPRHRPRAAARDHRPERRGQDHAVQPDQRALPRLERHHRAERPADRRAGPAPDQSPRPVPQLSDHLDLLAHVRCSRTSGAGSCGRAAITIHSGTCWDGSAPSTRRRCGCSRTSISRAAATCPRASSPMPSSARSRSASPSPAAPTPSCSTSRQRA